MKKADCVPHFRGIREIREDRRLWFRHISVPSSLEYRMVTVLAVASTYARKAGKGEILIHNT